MLKRIYVFFRSDVIYFFRALTVSSEHKSGNSIDFGFQKIRYNRISAVNYAVSKIKNGDVKYLEIGCNDNATFDSIPLLNKIGVDPFSGGNVRFTSDDFFIENNRTFDVIFIDGFHTYSQVKRDAINSSKCLNTGGLILLHDFLPANWKAALPNDLKQVSPLWNGDCFKFAFELIDNNIDFKILNIDHGIMVISGSDSIKALSVLSNELNKYYKNISFDYYVENFKKLPVVEFLDWIK